MSDDRFRTPRAKYVVKEYLAEGRAIHDAVSHELFSFAYWLEGQDRSGMQCRYHIIPALESECPFDYVEEME